MLNVPVGHEEVGLCLLSSNFRTYLGLPSKQPYMRMLMTTRYDS